MSWIKRHKVLSVLIGLVVIIGIGAAAGGGSGSSSGGEKPAASSSEQPGTSSGNKAHPPAADIEVLSCTVDDSVGFPKATVRITNHSSKKSDYFGNINFLDAAGTRVAQGAIIETQIEPGQSADADVVGDKTDVAGPVTCKLTQVERTASSS